MKRLTHLILMLFMGLSLSSEAMATDVNFFSEFEKYAKEEIDEVATPIVEAFGMAVGGGIYNSAKTHGVLGFDIGVRTMMLIIPEGESDIYDASDISFIAMPTVQVGLGLPMDIELMARAISVPFQDESLSLYGGGIKKNVSPHLPIPAMPDIAIIAAYHRFKAGDILTSGHFSLDLAVSKSFLVITPYAGFGIDWTKMDIEYTYVEDNPLLPNEPVEHTIDTRTTRLTLGLNVTPFPFVKLFADYNIGKFSQITAGLAVSFR